MKHLNTEELLEHFYTKSHSAEQHLQECAACGASYAALASDLAEMAFVDPPAREANYGAEIWKAIAPRLPFYEEAKKGWGRVHPWRTLSYAGACSVVLVVVFLAGRVWEHAQQHPATATNAPKQMPQKPAPATQQVVVVVLSDHLDRSERLLVELKHADSAEMASPLHDEAKSLLAANRVFQKSAHQKDDPELAAALDRLEPLLAELANQPAGLNSATLAKLQEEMNADGLLFQVRVLRSRIPSQRAERSARSHGGTT